MHCSDQKLSSRVTKRKRTDRWTDTCGFGRVDGSSESKNTVDTAEVESDGCQSETGVHTCIGEEKCRQVDIEVIYPSA